MSDPVYVHAKVGIVDDAWLTIGSANLNEHSLFNDTEMNVVCHDGELARATRLRLWAEHLEPTRATSTGAEPSDRPPLEADSQAAARLRATGRERHAPPRQAAELSVAPSACSARSRASSSTARAKVPDGRSGVEPEGSDRCERSQAMHRHHTDWKPGPERQVNRSCKPTRSNSLREWGSSREA